LLFLPLGDCVILSTLIRSWRRLAGSSLGFLGDELALEGALEDGLAKSVSLIEILID